MSRRGYTGVVGLAIGLVLSSGPAATLGGCSGARSTPVGQGSGGGLDAAADAPDDAPALDDGGDDAGSGDSADGGSRCAHLFCEDFESGQLDPLVWAIETGRGPTVSIEEQVVAHGTRAMHVHVPADSPTGGGYGFIVTRTAPAALRSHHFGRANVHVTPRIPLGNQQLIMAGTGAVPDLNHLFVAVAALGWMRDVHLGRVSAATETWQPMSSVPNARWTCFEWEMNASPGHIRLFLDGQPIAAVRAEVAVDPMSFGFDAFGFGFYGAQPNAGPVATYPFDLYYDDIALDIERIGCL